MPIGRSPPPPNTAGSYSPSGGQALTVIPPCAAVAVQMSGLTRTIRLCGAMDIDHPLAWTGFAIAGIALSASGTIITGRGSVITPLVEGSIPLVIDSPVFLAVTPGYVTQTAPSVTDSYVLRVGTAISTTQLVLTTDSLIRNP